MTAHAVEDLTHEYQALKLLQCEVIAGASEMFQDDIFYYMVGDVYNGGDFCTLKRRALGQGVNFTEDWWRDVFYQCLEGIAFMHEQAMMHCDIKEPNLMLRNCDFSQPKVVLIDLGVSTCMAKLDNGSPQGTPGYVPPETLETLMWFPRGDLFSMGVVIMQVITDKVPDLEVARDRDTPGGIFHEGCLSAKEIFTATCNREPPFHLMPEEYPLLSALVARLLQKKRKDRPTAPGALQDPWFAPLVGEDAGCETWAATEAYRGLRPKNRFATQGITKSLALRVMEQADDDDDGEDEEDDDAYKGAVPNKFDEFLERSQAVETDVRQADSQDL